MLQIKDIIPQDETKETLFDSFYEMDEEEWIDICKEYGYNEDNYDQQIDYINYIIENEMSVAAQILNTIKVNNGIVSIAQFGLWNGSVMAYKEYDRPESILYSNCERCTLLLNDNNELYKVTTHHGGTTNYEWLRAWRSGVNDSKKDEIMDKIYNEEITLEEIKKYTKPLRILKKHYK